MFACSGCFNRGIQREQIRLVRDIVYRSNDSVNLFREAAQIADNGLGSSNAGIDFTHPGDNAVYRLGTVSGGSRCTGHQFSHIVAAVLDCCNILCHGLHGCSGTDDTVSLSLESGRNIARSLGNQL
ncbi:hypothetical protein D3C80_1748200 [compost metagenome]